MLKELDIRTLMVVLSFAVSISTIALFIHRIVIPKVRGLGYFAGSFLFQILGSVFILARDFIPDTASIIAGNTLILIAYSLSWFGFVRFWKKSPKFIIPCTLGLCFLLLLGQYIVGYDTINLNKRIILISALSGLQLIFISIELLFIIGYRQPFDSTEVRPSYIGLWICFLGYISNAAFSIHKAIVWDPYGPIEMAFEPIMINYVNYFGGFILTVLIPLGIIIMTGESLHARIKDALMLDVLTGVFSRESFIDIANRMIANAKSQGNSVSLMMIDIDDFKKINDLHGRRAGDYVLKTLGDYLKDFKRTKDIVGRNGSDEFFMLLPSTNQLETQAIGENLAKYIQERPVFYRGTPISITISAGAATSERGGKTYGLLFAAAEEALRATIVQGQHFPTPA